MIAVNDFPMPRSLLESAARAMDDRQRAWLRVVPRRVAELAGLWSLELGEPYQPGGQTAWVAPVRDVSGTDLVLKVAWRHVEAEHEADGLRVWDGDGAVRLHASIAFDDTLALLIERCVPGSSLSTRPESQQDTVVASLLKRLWREPAPGHQFRCLQQLCDQWADEYETTADRAPSIIDSGLARDGIALFRELAATAERNLLLCADLHADNVLASRREPWLAIDPKPCVGDPTYDVLQHMLNCGTRLHSDPRALASRMADLLDLDRDRLLLWLFARCVQESAEWPALADIARRLAPAGR